MTDTNLVRYELSGSIATLTMDDGKANVMTEAMIGALSKALDRAEADRAVVILTGRGRIFSGGYDLSMFERSAEETTRTIKAGGEFVEKLFAFPSPVVAACNGHAVAQGAFVLLAADVRIGAAGAFKLGLNEVAIGLTIPHYGVELARFRLATPWFQHSTITGPLYTPEEAVQAGFLDRVVADPAEVLASAQQEAERLTRLDRAAHAGTKARVRAPALAAIRAGLEREFGSA